MMRLHTRSTLFHYTTLFRSQINQIRGDDNAKNEGCAGTQTGRGFRVRRARNSGTRPETSTKSDRKSTRLNSSHLVISYAVFCLKKKKHSNNSYDSHTD